MGTVMCRGSYIQTSVACLSGLLASIELLLFAACAYGWIGPWLAVAAHCVVLTAAAGWLVRHGPSNAAIWSIGLFTTFLTGPLGVMCVLALTRITRHSSLSADILNDWYRQISGIATPDPANLLHESIVADRAVRPDPSGPRNFLRVIRHGTLSEKQTLLGLVALKYHADYFPILTLALRSPEASVRAQAAAVFVRLKEQFKKRLEQNLACPAAGAQPAGPDLSLARVEAILACTESGFIDASEARSARAVAKALCESELSGGSATALAHDRLCRLLAASGEHAELVQRLGSRSATLPPDLKSLLANSLIILGRHSELCALLVTDNDDISAPDDQTSAAEPAAGLRLWSDA